MKIIMKYLLLLAITPLCAAVVPLWVAREDELAMEPIVEPTSGNGTEIINSTKGLLEKLDTKEVKIATEFFHQLTGSNNGTGTNSMADDLQDKLTTHETEMGNTLNAFNGTLSGQLSEKLASGQIKVSSQQMDKLNGNNETHNIIMSDELLEKLPANEEVLSAKMTHEMIDDSANSGEDVHETWGAGDVNHFNERKSNETQIMKIPNKTTQILKMEMTTNMFDTTNNENVHQMFNNTNVHQMFNITNIHQMFNNTNEDNTTQVNKISHMPIEKPIFSVFLYILQAFVVLVCFLLHIVYFCVIKRRPRQGENEAFVEMYSHIAET